VANADIVAQGLGLLEGPVWRPDTADLVVTGVGSGVVLRIDLTSGLAGRFAETSGGPNGAYPCEGGGVLIAQNGGLDWEAIGIQNPAPSQATTPGIQYVDAQGAVRLLTEGSESFRAPNDLCAMPDGTILFTDPPQFPPPPDPVGRVWSWVIGDKPQVLADGFRYCNGIGVDPRGAILVVEERGLMEVDPDGARRWLIQRLPEGGDGFAFDVEGNIYVAGGRSVTVVSPRGKVIEQLSVPPGPAMITNCCFGGGDLRTLYATDGGAGRVLAFAAMPVEGVPLRAVSLPNPAI
jgi:gluconolactonase